MKQATTEFKELINNGFPYHYINMYLENELLDVSFKSFNYYGLINSGESINIGNSCASHIEFELYNQNRSLEGKEVQVKVGIDVNGAIEEISLGYFTITKPTNTYEVSKYTAYDRMIKLEMPYATSLTNTTTIDVMNEIKNQTTYECVNNIESLGIDASKLVGYTIREVVGFISALYGANVIINSDGKIEFKKYTNTDIVIDNSKIYENGLEVKSDKEIGIGYLKCATGETIEHTSTDEEGNETTETENVILSVGTGSVGLTITNPIMTQDILNNVYYDVLSKIAYYPCKVQIVGNILLDCGDIVTINNGVTTYSVPIMNIQHTIDGGIVTNIEAIAQTETEQSINYDSPINKQIERVYQELITANKILANSIQAGNITTDYLKANYVDINKANIDTAWIQDLFVKGKLVTEKISADEGTFYELIGVKINGDIIQGNTIKADCLLLAGEDGLYYKLNVNSLGETIASADEKYQNGLDGSVIIAESITADKINVNELLANKIFAQDIVASGSISGLLINGINMNLKKEIAFSYDDENVAWIEPDVDKYDKPSLFITSAYGLRLNASELMILRGYNGIELYSEKGYTDVKSKTITLNASTADIVIDEATSSVKIKGTLTNNGNAVLTAGNYTTYCAKASHTHTIANITNLQSTLDGKANAHSHPYLSTTGGTINGALTVSGNINSNGILTVGAGSGTGGLINSQVNLGTTNASDGSRYYINNKGTGRFNSLKYASSGGYSSIRYKNTIEYKENDFWHNELMQMKICTYYYNNDEKTKHLGLIAEDLVELIPELVGIDEEGLPSSVEYASLTIPLIGEVQKLNNVIDNQQQEIDNLKEQMQQIMKLLER